MSRANFACKICFTGVIKKKNNKKKQYFISHLLRNIILIYMCTFS